jgi:predicted small lipoprotein YifL
MREGSKVSVVARRATLLLPVLLAALAGCGQKGPLTLPGAASAPASAPAR